MNAVEGCHFLPQYETFGFAVNPAKREVGDNAISEWFLISAQLQFSNWWVRVLILYKGGLRSECNYFVTKWDVLNASNFQLDTVYFFHCLYFCDFGQCRSV